MASKKEIRKAKIDEIIANSFKELQNWQRPDLIHTFGANDFQQIDTFEASLIKLKSEVQESLEQTSDDHLERIITEIENRFKLSELSRVTLQAMRIERHRKVVPPPIAYGFGHPSLSAKFEHWARMPELSLNEVSALSVGAEPRKVTGDKITELQRSRDKGKRLWAAEEGLLEQREIFRRCFRFTGFGYVSESISRIKHMIDSLDVKVHPEFYAGLQSRLTQLSEVVVGEKKPLETPVEAKAFSTQERDTLLKMIAAMACEQYSYDPNAERSDAPTRIREDIEHIGQTIDAKTVRKWLKEATNLVDPDYWKS